MIRAFSMYTNLIACNQVNARARYAVVDTIYIYISINQSVACRCSRMNAADDWNFKCVRSLRNSQSILDMGNSRNCNNNKISEFPHKEHRACACRLFLFFFFFSLVFQVILCTFHSGLGSRCASHCPIVPLCHCAIVNEHCEW